MNGYICLYRKMLDWEWMQEPLTAHLFTCMLLMANSVDGWRFQGIELKAGQLISSVKKLADRCGMTTKQVRRRLDRLQDTGEIVTKRTNKYTLITICNYGSYQYDASTDGQTKGKQRANKGQTKGEQINRANPIIPLNSSDTSTSVGIEYLGGQTKGKQDNAENVGKQMGKQRANGMSAETSSESEVYKDNISIDELEKGKQMGNIQYNSISNTIDIKKKNKEKKDGEYTVQELEQMFEDFRRAYKGTKRGFQPEFDNFKKKHQDWKAIVPLLMPALERMNAWREQQTAAGCFVPQYAMLQTWLNQGRWTTEYEITEPKPNDHGNEKHTQCWSDNRPDAQGSFNYDETF